MTDSRQPTELLRQLRAQALRGRGPVRPADVIPSHVAWRPEWETFEPIALDSTGDAVEVPRAARPYSTAGRRPTISARTDSHGRGRLDRTRQRAPDWHASTHEGTTVNDTQHGKVSPHVGLSGRQREAYRPCYLGPQGWRHEPGCPQYGQDRTAPGEYHQFMSYTPTQREADIAAGKRNADGTQR